MKELQKKNKKITSKTKNLLSRLSRSVKQNSKHKKRNSFAFVTQNKHSYSAFKEDITKKRKSFDFIKEFPLHTPRRERSAVKIEDAITPVSIRKEETNYVSIKKLKKIEDDKKNYSGIKKNLALDLKNKKSKTGKEEDNSRFKQENLLKNSKIRNSLRERGDEFNPENLKFLKEKRKKLLDKSFKNNKVIKISSKLQKMVSRDSSQDTLILKKNQTLQREIISLKDENKLLKNEISMLKTQLRQVRKHLSNFITTKNEEIDFLKQKLEEVIKDNTIMANQQNHLLKKFVDSQEEIRKLKKLMMHYPSQKSIIQQSSRESSVVMMSNFLVDEIKNGQNPVIDFTKESSPGAFGDVFLRKIEGNIDIEYSSFIEEKSIEESDVIMEGVVWPQKKKGGE